MTFQEFITKNNNQYVEVAGSSNAKYQCVDLANAYICYVLNMPIIEHTDAKDFPSKVGPEYDWIEYSSGKVPLYGDIMIWNTTVGSAGHIAVYIKGNDKEFTSFDQNWPINSPCHEQSHSYQGVEGWLRYKQSNQLTQEDMKELEELKQMEKDTQAHLQVIENKVQKIIDMATNANGDNRWKVTGNKVSDLHDKAFPDQAKSTD